MDTILELLVVFPLFTNFMKVPQPPERVGFNDAVFPYATVVLNDDTESEIPEKIEEEKITPTPKASKKKTIYNMTEEELSALSIKKKAKLVHMSKKTFKTFTKLVSRESGPKMQDKIMVAAVVWNRKYCKQFPNTVKKVMYEPGQFTLRGQKKTVIHGNYKDKDAQLAILLAYRKVNTGKIPHDVLYFNCISYKIGSKKRYKKYKHYNNYFIRDVKCNCKSCSSSRRS